MLIKCIETGCMEGTEEIYCVADMYYELCKNKKDTFVIIDQRGTEHEIRKTTTKFDVTPVLNKYLITIKNKKNIISCGLTKSDALMRATNEYGWLFEENDISISLIHGEVFADNTALDLSDY